MATEVILPRVDMDMSSGQISRWYIEEGGTVEKGQVLFEIETDKAAMEIEAPASGILRNVSAATGVSVPVGSVVAWIAAPGEALAEKPSEPAQAAAAVPPSPAAVTSSPAVIEPPVIATDGRPRATPLARRLARESGVDLAAVSGSGPRGRILSGDIRSAKAVPVLTARTEAPVPAPRAVAAHVSPPLAPAGGPLNRVWLRQGEGDPVVLVHGFGADFNNWRQFIAGLPTANPVLAIDLPGHGQSPLTETISLDAFAAAVEATLEAEGVSALHLAGHSLGGAVAATVAAQAARDVRSLFLIAPGGLGPDINGAFLSGFTRARSEASLLPWLRELVADPATLSPAFVKATLRQRLEGDIATTQERIASALFPDGTQATSIRNVLEHVAVPAKVIFGTDDRIIPARHASGLPGSIALHLFAGVGHMPHIEARVETGRLLAELVRSAA